MYGHAPSATYPVFRSPCTYVLVHGELKPSQASCTVMYGTYILASSLEQINVSSNRPVIHTYIRVVSISSSYGAPSLISLSNLLLTILIQRMYCTVRTVYTRYWRTKAPPHPPPPPPPRHPSPPRRPSPSPPSPPLDVCVCVCVCVGGGGVMGRKEEREGKRRREEKTGCNRKRGYLIKCLFGHAGPWDESRVPFSKNVPNCASVRREGCQRVGTMDGEE